MSIERRNSSSRVSMRRGSKPQAPPESISIKCVALGDGAVGKTAMLLSYVCGYCPSEIAPGPMDWHSEYDHLTQGPQKISVETTHVHMTLIDSCGQDEYEKLRERVCASADVYILCYDVSRPSSFGRIRHHWLPEIRRYAAPDTPFIIVGLKSDMRSANNTDETSKHITCTSYTQGLKEAEEMGASHYIECSPKTNPSSVKRVLEKAAHAACLNASNSSDLKRSSCSLS